MKLMIEIPDSTYESIMARDWENAGWLFNDELKAIHDGIHIPDNATNGDVIKALFNIKEAEIEMSHTYYVRFPEEDLGHYFSKDWWNAPFKRGEME